MLKFRIPAAVGNPKILCEIPFGSIERPSDGSEQVCHRWTALCGGDGDFILYVRGRQVERASEEDAVRKVVEYVVSCQ